MSPLSRCISNKQVRVRIFRYLVFASFRASSVGANCLEFVNKGVYARTIKPSSNGKFIVVPSLMHVIN